jgi:hypothetical protein
VKSRNKRENMIKLSQHAWYPHDLATQSKPRWWNSQVDTRKCKMNENDTCKFWVTFWAIWSYFHIFSHVSYLPPITATAPPSETS